MLAWRNGARRLPGSRQQGLLAAAIGAPVAAILLLLALYGGAARAALSALGAPWVVIAVAAIYAVALIAKLKRRTKSRLSRSWLAATPQVDSGGTATTAWLVAIPFVGHFSLAAVAAAALSLNAGVTLDQVARLLALAVLGYTGGALVAWAWPNREPKARHEASRYTRRPRARGELMPNDAALACWPIAQALAWSRPENSRQLLIVALISVPAGTHGLYAVGILAAWALLFYLIAVLAAVAHVARQASLWLRPTPLRVAALAWPITRRAAVHEAVGTFVAMTAMRALGTSWPTVVYIGMLWAAVVTATAAVVFAECRIAA